eukprot:3275792-Prymnesium_polylepis.1
MSRLRHAPSSKQRYVPSHVTYTGVVLSREVRWLLLTYPRVLRRLPTAMLLTYPLAHPEPQTMIRRVTGLPPLARAPRAKL